MDTKIIIDKLLKNPVSTQMLQAASGNMIMSSFL